jgi:Fur family transcriptional regulator, ferric uptake regulator
MDHNHVQFKEKGLKKTKQRNEIVEIIAHAKQPLSAEEIFLALSKLKIAVNLSTVYRTIETMVAKGILAKVNLDNEVRNRYELVDEHEHHHHLICLGCKKIVSIELCPLDSFEKQVSKTYDFKVTNHKLELYGYCEKCTPH